MKIEGSVALVTGASSGIGEATAQRLAMAGYKVYGTSRRGAQAGDRPFEMLPLDVTSDRSVEATVGEVMRLAGRIDLLVNNAGFGVAPAGAEESSIEQARSIFDTNFFGIVRMTRAVVPRMRQQGGGRIINIGSVLGFLPMPYGALYTATKHAVNGFVKSVAREVGRDGITVNSVCPGLVLTDMVQEKAGQALGLGGVDDLIKHYTEETALGRCVTVEEIAAFCVHLASDDGAGFSGANISLDGGTAFY